METGLRERKKDKLRWALVHSALRLFEEQGFSATTAGQIASSVDVSRRTFHRYFPAKDDVVVIDAEHKLELIRDCIGHRRPEESVLDAVARLLQAMAANYASDIESISALNRIAPHEPAIMARLREFQVTWQFALAQVVASELRLDLGRDPRPEVVAAAAVAASRVGLGLWSASGYVGDPGSAIGDAFAPLVPALRFMLGEAAVS